MIDAKIMADVRRDFNAVMAELDNALGVNAGHEDIAFTMQLLILAELRTISAALRNERNGV